MEVVTLDQLGRIAPITIIILSIMWVARKATINIYEEYIAALKEQIKYLQVELEKRNKND